MQQKIYLNLKEKLENSLNKGLFFILKIFLETIEEIDKILKS